MPSLESLSGIDVDKKTPSSPEPPSSASDSAASIDQELKLLGAEQSLRLQKKAADLHEQIKAKHRVIKHLDELMALLASRAQTRPYGEPNTDGTIDCQDTAVRSLINTLRSEGVSVPLPDGILSQAERNNAVNALVNQRELLSDEEREKGQEFQQCVTEQNSFTQFITSVEETYHRIMMKLVGNIEKRAS